MNQAPLAPPLYRQASDALAQDIAQGLLPAGEALTQLGIARRFGISRAPARRALEELAYFTSSLHILGVYPADPLRALQAAGQS